MLVISVCCVINVYAQQDISQRINDIMYSRNTEECGILIQQIKDSDIALMPDSTLFKYYYLSAWYYYENDEIEKQIEYLVKAKDVCETRLGIDNYVFVYFEIIKALGAACEFLNQNDEALLWYEEGMVKGLPYLGTDNETLQSYFKDIRNYSAKIYEMKGYKDMAMYLRSDNPLDYVGSFEYACELLDKAIQLYNENEYNDAIKFLDEAKDIFRRCGNDGRDMLQPLYRGYLLCYAGLGNTKEINKLLKNQSNTMFTYGDESYLVHDMYEVISNYILLHYDIKTADYYYQKLCKKIDNHNIKDKQVIDEIGKQIQFFQEIYFQIDSLENVKTHLPLHTYEWGVTSLLQSNLLIKIKRENDANEICKQIYSMSVNLVEDPQNIHWFVLMNLADYYNQKNNFSEAERYLSEQLEWLDSNKFPLNSEVRGWVYSKLAIAYMYGEQFKKAENSINKAEQILVPVYGYQSQEYATILHNKGRLAQLNGKLDEAKQHLEKSVKIQIELEGKAMDKTTQYLDEVNHAIKVRL